ncbi:enoyl-CoA hydratase/isomerase [Rhodopila sp.]|uniref:enoyl-CoA hydratase/isomerase n=1 Tax=Rhodopila sp. TaxID=2480087 RepID=UPI003D0EBCC2
MKHGKILLETTRDVTVMTLNDPSVLNAFGQKLREDMTTAMDRIEQDPPRCLVITGAGRAFCSGANLNDPDQAQRNRAAEASGELTSTLESWYNPMFMRLRALSIPVVTAINGIAAGAGMSLALSGDIRIAARSASFLQAFARIGLVPDCGSSWLLPRLIGMARAMELSLLAERLSAETALAWGLINRLEEDADLMPKTMQLAHGLAAGPKSLGMIRQMYWESMENTYSSQLDLEARLQSRAGMTSDYNEGVAAFREKRPAKFRGQ